MTKPERQTYKIAGRATWELIRAAYLGGDSAPALAERFGVSVHAIRKRITNEGWSKRDYANSLEARGLRPPAEQKVDYIDEAVMRQNILAEVEAGKAAQREAEVSAWIDQVSAEQDASDIADALERRALAQASAAVVQGRSKDAQALAGLADQMRKRKTERDAAPPPRAAPDAIVEDSEPDDDSFEGLKPDQRETMVMDLFGKIAYVAAAMVHQPTSAPGTFLQLIKRWREINMGEGEADAEARAAKIAAAHDAYVNGDWTAGTPEDVRAYLNQRWEETRVRLEGR